MNARARGHEERVRPALDAGRLRSRLEPVVRRRLGPQRRTAGDPRELRSRRRRGAMGGQRLSCCRFRPCCCSAGRSATITAGAACWSSAQACSPQPRCSARWPLTLQCCSSRARSRASARPCCCPTASRCSTPRSKAKNAAARSAFWAAAGAATAAIAPLIGGWLVDTVGWPAIFYINLPLAFGAILLGADFRYGKPRLGAGRTDYAGALLATAGLGGATYGLTRWSSSGAIDAFAGCSIAGGLASWPCSCASRNAAAARR